MALWNGEGKLGIAVSGGPDSLALLLLAHAAMPEGIEAATVDHGLRLESRGEAEFVACVCKALGVEHDILPVTVGQGNLQSEARYARYSALAGWMSKRGIGELATAHHADDQAETFLMRANRGSGLSGLLGVRAQGMVPLTRYTLIRPLLSWRKSELGDLVMGTGIEPVSDLSNRDTSFDRVRMRTALTQSDWLDPAALAKSARLLGEAQAFIDGALSDTWNAHVGEKDSECWYYPGENRFENIEVVSRIIERMGGETSRSDVGLMVDRLANQQNASLSGILARPGVDKDGLGHDGWRWDFAPEPPRKTG